MMATSVEVLCPNGHRQTVKTNPNTKLMQVLEEVCTKKGFQPPSEYDLKHGRNTLDLTLTVRFAGLANKAKLELVKATTARKEENVVLVLQVPSGERLQESFPPATSLWDILCHWQAKGHPLIHSDSGGHPVCIYVREEIIGEFAQRNTTLKSLGLLGGKAILRVTHRQVDDVALAGIRDSIEKEQERLSRIAAKAKQKAIEEQASIASPIPPANKPTGQSNTQISMGHNSQGVTALSCDTGNHNKQTPELASSSQSTNQMPPAGQQTDHGRESPMECGSSSSSSLPGSSQMSDGASGSTDSPMEVEAAASSHSMQPEPVSKSHKSGDQQKQKGPLTKAEREQRMMARMLPGMHIPSSQIMAGASFSTTRPVVPYVAPAPLAEFKFPEETKGKELYRNELSAFQKEDYMPCDRETVLYSLDSVVVATDAMEQEPSDDFFEVTKTDFAKMYAEVVSQQQESEAPLMTSAMRQSQREAKMDHYPQVVIRVRFPDRHILQGVFKPRESVFALYKFVKEHLEDKTLSFYLYTTPPRKELKDKAENLFDANLTPLSVVYFGTDSPKEKYLSTAVLAESTNETTAQNVVIKYFKTSQGHGASTSSNAASVKRHVAPSTSGGASKNQDGEKKVPKWFKMGKK